MWELCRDERWYDHVSGRTYYPTVELRFDTQLNAEKEAERRRLLSGYEPGYWFVRKGWSPR